MCVCVNVSLDTPNYVSASNRGQQLSLQCQQPDWKSMFLMREMQNIARENLGDRLEKDNFKILLEMSSLNVHVLISASHTVQRVHWLHIKGGGGINSYQGHQQKYVRI